MDNENILALLKEIAFLKSETFIKIDLIEKGWSGDQKYYIETKNKKYLLRISDVNLYDRKLNEYKLLEKASSLNIKLTTPIEFNYCNNKQKVYSLLYWIDGEDVDSILNKLPKIEQYQIGMRAGELLKKLHCLPAPKNTISWNERFNEKINQKINFYNKNKLQNNNVDLIIKYLQDNKQILNNRFQTFNHGDYNTTNLIYTPNGEIGVIDFNSYNLGYGDPWWEFCSVNWGEKVNKYYLTGLFNGYFNNKEIPIDFFKLQAYYFAYDALVAFCCTSEYDGGVPADGVNHINNTLISFNYFNNVIPNWYLKDISKLNFK